MLEKRGGSYWLFVIQTFIECNYCSIKIKRDEAAGGLIIVVTREDASDCGEVRQLVL